ncbi:MAG: hypothetical protein ACKN9T_11410 [Candidatus Methylumidiphilus sp.]
MQANLIRNSALLAAAIAVSACSSTTPPVEAPPLPAPKIKSGEQMLLESENLAKFGSQWKAGQLKVQEGE